MSLRHSGWECIRRIGPGMMAAALYINTILYFHFLISQHVIDLQILIYGFLTCSQWALSLMTGEESYGLSRAAVETVVCDPVRLARCQ